MLGAAHKPGAMPLRPLGLGDIYDAAFRIIRFNPKATVGSAVLVAAVADGDPGRGHRDPDLDRSTSPLDATGDGPDAEDLAGIVGTFGALGLGAVLQVVRDDPGDRDDRPRHRGRRDRPAADPGRGLGGDPRQALAADRAAVLLG